MSDLGCNLKGRDDTAFFIWDGLARNEILPDKARVAVVVLCARFLIYALTHV